eukprot:m.235993 g.235993  ORF g.235993 m.235993 type:complete len:1096 (-) comp12913_c0_seq1:104-3391(-)
MDNLAAAARPSEDAAQVAKLQNHIELLKAQHRKLQARTAELEKLAATAGGNQDSIAALALKFLDQALDKPTFSDIIIHVEGKSIYAHRWVLSLRGRWTDADLSTLQEITFDSLSYKAVFAILRWTYTDVLEDTQSISFQLELMRAAHSLLLGGLKLRCEQALMPSVSTSNAIAILLAAHDVEAAELKKFATTIVLDNWALVPQDELTALSAQLLYDLIQQKTRFPLHMATRFGREDIVFLVLIDHDADMADRINELDENGNLPLHLALVGAHESIANSLISHGADVNARYPDGSRLLHGAIARRDKFAAEFLIKARADINAATPNNVTPLHLCAEKGMEEIATSLLQNGAYINTRDSNGNTPLQTALVNYQPVMVTLFLAVDGIDINNRNNEGHTPLWMALSLTDTQYARTLVSRGCDINLVSTGGNTMLHHSLSIPNEKIALFLIENGASTTLSNNSGETPLHIAVKSGLSAASSMLLEHGAEVNARDSKQQTPLMLAVQGKQAAVLKILLGRRDLDVNALDSNGACALGMALNANDTELASFLVSRGASVNVKAGGYTLVHSAILNEHLGALRFLLQNRADIEELTNDGETPLQLAVSQGKTDAVVVLCEFKAQTNVVDSKGFPPLWHAMNTRQEKSVEALVRGGAMVNANDPTHPGESLLHLAVRGQIEYAVFKLCSAGANANIESQDSRLAPLHLAADTGTANIANILLQFSANVNARDGEGKTPLMRAIVSKQADVAMLFVQHPKLDLRLRDSEGHTCFWFAVNKRDQPIALALQRRDPQVTEERNEAEMTHLHAAIGAKDAEAVHFLLNMGANANAAVRDSTARMPLYMAIERGLDEVVKALLQSGADPSTPDKSSGWTPAHMAASLGFTAVLEVLLQARANISLLDGMGNSVLHAAVSTCQPAVVERVLQVDRGAALATQANSRGETPLHALAMAAASNTDAAIRILQLLHPFVSKNLNPIDGRGNTPLYYSCSGGAGKFSASLIRNGGQLALPNNDGDCCFDVQFPDKRILYSLVDSIKAEQPWIDAPTCQGCKQKFGVSTRKHHCRHCGRVLCSRCSSQQVPMPKFNVNKPARACDVCFIVLNNTK